MMSQPVLHDHHRNNFNDVFGNKTSINQGIEENNLDKILSEYSIEYSNARGRDRSINFDLMTEFREMNVWPQKTNVHCWWCRHDFNTMPIAIPSEFKDGKFSVYGCFCSFNCSLAHLYDEKGVKQWEKVRLIKLLGQEMGINLDVNKFSPSWKILKQYGGLLTIHQFREGFITNQNTSILDFPIISRKSQMEIHSSIVPKGSKEFKKKPKNLFYLKKKETKKVHKSSLERSMGIRIL
jgi:hypothetical protein